MTTDPCEGCGRRVRVAGGIGDMWNAPGPSGGMTLEYDDGREEFLCFDCIEALPDDPNAVDVAAVDGDAADGDAAGEDP
ncbi:hypothetical protein G9C85_17305 [Halorubellus sp. JP-L1]|uniref:DUF7561 family protein n=1 Tax=Halorubellus sp. JP-L1 TaxID=2715753 RepID=UPI001409DAF4|nr:hypothetical protein [Halorubellus sp. JP-L1]